MADFLGLIQQALFFGFVITVALAALSAILLPVSVAWLNRRFPACTRASLYTFFSVLPVLATLLILLLAILPSLLQILGISNDHCLGHPEGHLHFCLVHRHDVINHWLVWLPALLYPVMLARVVVVLAADILAIRQFRLTLQQFRRIPCDDNAVLLKTKTPLALSCGLFKPDIYLSTGLTDRLSTVERQLVIAHEQAHGRRLDALRLWLARGLSMAHLPATRRHLLDELGMACEQACDEASLESRQQPDRLATLLLKIERLYQGYFPAASPLAPAVTGSVLEARIRYLLLPLPRLPVNPAHLLGLLCLVSLGLLLAHDAIHDGLEHLMSLLTPHLTHE